MTWWWIWYCILVLYFAEAEADELLGCFGIVLWYCTFVLIVVVTVTRGVLLQWHMGFSYSQSVQLGNSSGGWLRREHSPVTVPD